LFCLASSKVNIIHRSHVNSGIQNSDHFDIFCLYHTTLRKSKTALTGSRVRGSGRLLLPVTWKKIKEQNAHRTKVTTFAVHVSCEGYSQVCMTDSKEGEWAELQRKTGVVEKCVSVLDFWLENLSAGTSSFSSNANTSPCSGLWSEKSAGSVLGYREHLEDVSLLIRSWIEPLQICKEWIMEPAGRSRCLTYLGRSWIHFPPNCVK